MGENGKDWIQFEDCSDDGATVVLRKAASWLHKQKYHGSLPGFIEIQGMSYNYDSEWHEHKFTISFLRY
jgi:hypothetical protein